MIKKFLLCLALVVPFLASSQTLKIGVVNVNEVIATLPDTQAAQTRLQEAQQKYETEGQKLQDEMKRKYEEYDKVKDDALPAIKQRMESELQDYGTKIQQFMASADQDLQKLQADLMQPIIMKVRDAISSVGKEGGYSLIQNLDDTLIFYHAAPVVDITPDVKAKLGVK